MKLWLTILAFFVLMIRTQAQLEVNSIPSGSSNETEVIRTHFADSNIIILSAGFWALPGGTGTFSQGTDVIGMDGGLLICTGAASEIAGPPSENLNVDQDFSEHLDFVQQVHNFQGDEDLQILNIEFIPLGDSIHFNFVYASEHYGGLECGADYDFLEARLSKVENAGGYPPVNMLTVPGKEDIVLNANTVNNGSVALGSNDSTYCTALDPDWQSNSQFYAGSHPGLAFNGFTKVLPSRKTAVVPNERYYLWVTIAEGKNAWNDSAIFLEKGSFSSNSDQTAQYEVIHFNTTFCDTLRIGDLVITEGGSYFGEISAPGSQVDTFAYFGVYKITDRVTVDNYFCPGDTLFLADTFFVAPTTFIETGQNQDGCDSITTHRIRYDLEADFSLFRSHSLCLGDTLFIADTFFVESAQYIEEIGTDAYCDTTLRHDIIFSEAIQFDQEITACKGDTIFLLDTFFVDPVRYQKTFPGVDACDTIVNYQFIFQELSFNVNLPTSYCNGDTIQLRYGTDLSIHKELKEYNNSDTLYLPDKPGIPFSSSIWLNQFPEGFKVNDAGGILQVCVNIEHEYMYDLEFILIAPNGKKIFLDNLYPINLEVYLGEPDFGVSGNSDPIPGRGYNYCWTKSAEYSWNDYVLQFSPDTLPAGEYIPAQDFELLGNSPVNGEWKLIIYDRFELDDGVLFDWSISFEMENRHTIREQGWLNQAPGLQQDSLSLVINPGPGNHSYTYFVIDANGCYGDTSLNITVTELPSPPSTMDTIICDGEVVFGHHFDVSGQYQVEVGPPYFCENGITTLNVNVLEKPDIGGAFWGSQNTYNFVVVNPTNDNFYIDFGDGDTSHLANVSHSYDAPGIYTFCFVAENICDTARNCDEITVPNWYSIGGKLETAFPSLSGILDVRIDLSTGEVPFSTTSDENGAYQFDQQWEALDYAILPTKTGKPLNGLDVADIIMLHQSLHGTRDLVAPYQLLAADLDCNQFINNQDIQYFQRLLLEAGSGFPDSCSNWIFWPQSYIFPDPESPFGHPKEITISALSADSTNNDFYGLKRGDLGGNASAAREVNSHDTLFFILKNGAVAAGDTMEVNFRARNFSDLVGFQFELNFDTTALQFESIALGEVPGINYDHFGLTAIEKGILRVIWLDILAQTHSLSDLDVAFSFQFVAKQPISDRSLHLFINDHDLAPKAFDANLQEVPVALQFDLVSHLHSPDQLPFTLFQNRPNPFEMETVIPFELPQPCKATLSIYNQFGQKVWQKTGQYPSGHSEENIMLDTPGVYLYILETPWGRAIKKLIVVI